MRNAGIGRVSMEVLNRLEARGHEVTKFCDESEGHASYLKYTLFDIPRRLPKGQDVYCALTPMEGAFLPRDKSVTLFLDLIPILYPEKAGAGLNRNSVYRYFGCQYFKFMASRASRNSRLVCISEQTKDDVVKCFGVKPEKIKVLYPGINQSLEPKPKRDRAFRIGYLGQLDKRKRVDLLINAFKESEIKGELVIAGAGVDEHKLILLAESDRRIKFPGFIPDDELCDFYNSLDLFVFPTACEGLGLPPIEAMACKKPVLILSDAIMPKEIKDMAYTCFQDNFTEMLSNLYFSYLNTGWQGKYAPQKVAKANWFSKYFTWDRFMKGFESVLEEVANG